MKVAQVEPRLSILLAVHNGGRYVEEAIDSVIGQTFRDWELIVVENGSTDDTRTICERKADADSRVRVFSIPEKGKNRAYNHGYEQARGRYVCFFAADDLLPPDSLAVRVGALEGAGPLAFSTCCLWTFSEDPKYDNVVFPKNRDPNYAGGSMLFSRALADRVFPLPEAQPNEDTWTLLHLRAFGRNRHVPEPLYRYRIHGSNSFGYGVSFEEKREGYLKRMHAYRLFFEKYSDSDVPFIREEVAPFLEALAAAESRSVVRILRVRGVPARNKVVLIFYCSRLLYNIRHRFFRTFSGGVAT